MSILSLNTSERNPNSDAVGSEYESWEDYFKWLQDDSCVWDVPLSEKKWHVLRDAEGVLHVADVKKDKLGSVVYAMGKSTEGEKSSQVMKLFFEKGSLISIKENVESITIPSEEEKLKMYPCDFEEFAMALGEEMLLEYIAKCFADKVPLEDHFHKRAMHLFREYMLVGGMPKSIVAYMENERDFSKSDKEKRKILDLYRDDIKKAAKRYSSKVSALFENIPSSLSSHEKKIVLSEIDDSKAVTFSKYDEPFFWLDDSMICNLCYKCNDPNVGFALNKNESAVKCYMGDTGLLVSLAFSENEIASNQLYKAIMNGKLSLNEGMLYENMIAQMIRAKGRQLYFYTEYDASAHRNSMEIDFLLSNESKTNFKVFPVEVKSSKNYTTTSLGKFKAKFKKRVGKSIIIHPKALQVDGDTLKIPPYMTWCL